MIKGCLFTAAGLMLLFMASPAPLNAQDMAINGNFELQALGPWDMTGSNNNAAMATFDVDGDGTATNCWMKEPGTNGGNGGLEQKVLLVAGVTYDITCDVAYYTC